MHQAVASEQEFLEAIFGDLKHSSTSPRGVKSKKEKDSEAVDGDKDSIEAKRIQKDDSQLGSTLIMINILFFL